MTADPPRRAPRHLPAPAAASATPGAPPRSRPPLEGPVLVHRAPGAPAHDRIAFLEAVRGIAAALVIAEHVLIGRSDAYLAWTLQNFSIGRAGVVAFFLVSGYVIPLSLARQSVRTFAVRRFFRLYPTYWLALAALVVLGVDVARGLAAHEVLANALMVQTLVAAPLLLGPAWTLSLELVYYAQSATAKRLGRLDRSTQLGWVWLGGYLAAAVVERVRGVDLPGTFALMLFCAALGHALHLRVSAGDGSWKPLLAASLVVVPAGALVGTGLDGGEPWSPLALSASYAGGLLLFAGCAVLGRRSVPGALLRLGAISYALYVLHPAVGALLHDRLGLEGPLALVLEIGGILVLARLVHRFVEQPSIRLGRRLTSPVPRRAPDPAEQGLP
ncbi:acyltransferase family protein [Kineococcus sp. SYSU DK006]|uniref:acyltransferase family protein n=1 Tax=Kineococcus sp. SYSU DK006 TaxID=3383127 RepID=UPI003D7D59A4